MQYLRSLPRHPSRSTPLLQASSQKVLAEVTQLRRARNQTSQIPVTIPNQRKRRHLTSAHLTSSWRSTSCVTWFVVAVCASMASRSTSRTVAWAYSHAPTWASIRTMLPFYWLAASLPRFALPRSESRLTTRRLKWPPLQALCFTAHTSLWTEHKDWLMHKRSYSNDFKLNRI